MSEVSLEAESGKTSAEDPQVDCEDADKVEEGFSEDVKVESADNNSGRDVSAEVMYDIDINSSDENAEKRAERESIQKTSVVMQRDGVPAHKSGTVDNGGQEAPQESEDSDTEAKVIFTVILVNQLLLALPYCASVAVLILIYCGGGHMNLSNRCRVVISLLCSCFAGDFSKMSGAAVALGVAGGSFSDYIVISMLLY